MYPYTHHIPQGHMLTCHCRPLVPFQPCTGQDLLYFQPCTGYTKVTAYQSTLAHMSSMQRLCSCANARLGGLMQQGHKDGATQS
jgi:hypothetical protein